MKKLLSLFLLLALSVTLFVGCTNQPTEPTDPPAPQSFLESAKTLLFNEYKPASKDEVPEKKKDFALLTNVMAGGDNHSVVWTVTVTSGDPEAVKIVDNAKVDVPENSSVEILFTLNATISDPYGNSANLSFNFKVPVYVPSSLSVVDPVAGEAYKMGMVQGNLDDTLYYFAGGKSGTYYLGTSENEADALDVYLETTEGGYYLYYMENDAKVYINHVISGTHVNGTYEATPSTVYTYDAELRTITIKVQAEDDAEPVVYLLGTRSTKNNTDLGFYKLSDKPFYVKFYGFDPNACVHTGGTPSCTQKAVCDLCGEEYGVKLDHEYDATTHLCICGAHDPSVTVTLTIPEALATPDGQNVVVSGTVSSIYQAYSPDFNNISVYITDGNGNTLYVYRLTGEVSVGDIITVTGTMASYNGSKQIAQGGTFVKTGHDNSYDYVNMTIPEVLAAEDGVNVIVSGTVVEINGEWSTQYKNMNVTIADANGNKLYVYRTSTQVTLGDIITVKGSVGSYNGAKQIAQGSTAEITGHDDSVGSGTTEPSEPSTPSTSYGYVDLPAVGTAYKLVMNQAGLGKHLGITGDMNGYYWATTEDYAAMVDVYLEANGNGYSMYFMANGVKTYLNIIPRDNDATKTNVVFQTLEANAAPTVYTLNTEYKYIYAAGVASADWYLGTYGTNVTVGASKTSYISDTSTIGSTQFVAWFAAETTDEPGTDVPGDDDTTTAPSVETTAPAATEPQTLTLAEALTLGASKAHNTYTSEKYYVVGVIVEVYNTTYGNMRIKDANGNILTVYGTYDADGTNRYDAMATKPVAGDTVKVLGVLGQYNNTPQMKNGWVVEISGHTCVFADATCTEPSKCTLCDAVVEGSVALGHLDENKDHVCERNCGITVGAHVDADGDTVCDYGCSEAISESKPMYVKVTSAEDFTSGKYVIIANNNVAMGTFSSGWILTAKPTVVDGVVTDTANAVWTVTVNGTSATLTDANGVSIAPKSGNNNGIQSGSYNWAWAMDANGNVTFKGTGSDTTILASNTGSENKFRAYKTSTVSGNPSGYPSLFSVYKLVEG